MSRSSILIAILTIALWSFLAFLGSQLTRVPPFFLVGSALCIGSLIGLPQVRSWRVPLRTFLIGVYGLFGYHFLFFSALQFAPAVEANLLNYLWPLLIVLMTPVFLPGNRLSFHHIMGALMGLAGAGLIVTGGKLSLDLAYLPGYLMAAGAGFVWASYSLLTKRVPPFPTAAIAGYCLASGLFSLAVYFSRTPSLAMITSLSAREWFFILLLGAGPMGLAFFTWDMALKRGDSRVIGSMAYLTPLISTLNLVLLARRPFTWVSAIAMLLIFGGAITGSLDLILKQDRQRTLQPDLKTSFHHDDSDIVH